MWEKSPLEVFESLGVQGDLSRIEREYLRIAVEIDEAFYDFASKIKKRFRLALLSNDSSEWSRYFRKKIRTQ